MRKIIGLARMFLVCVCVRVRACVCMCACIFVYVLVCVLCPSDVRATITVAKIVKGN